MIRRALRAAACAGLALFFVAAPLIVMAMLATPAGAAPGDKPPANDGSKPWVEVGPEDGPELPPVDANKYDQWGRLTSSYSCFDFGPYPGVTQAVYGVTNLILCGQVNYALPKPDGVAPPFGGQDWGCFDGPDAIKLTVPFTLPFCGWGMGGDAFDAHLTPAQLQEGLSKSIAAKIAIQQRGGPIAKLTKQELVQLRRDLLADQQRISGLDEEVAAKNEKDVKDLFRAVTCLIPPACIVQSVVEVATGTNSWTGEKLSGTERAVLAGGVVLAGAAGVYAAGASYVGEAGGAAGGLAGEAGELGGAGSLAGETREATGDLFRGIFGNGPKPNPQEYGFANATAMKDASKAVPEGMEAYFYKPKVGYIEGGVAKPPSIGIKSSGDGYVRMGNATDEQRVLIESINAKMGGPAYHTGPDDVLHYMGKPVVNDLDMAGVMQNGQLVRDVSTNNQVLQGMAGTSSVTHMGTATYQDSAKALEVLASEFRKGTPLLKMTNGSIQEVPFTKTMLQTMQAPHIEALNAAKAAVL
jgi:hypothetical protein